MTKNQSVINLLKSLIMFANREIKIHQDLIDEWNDPKDIAVRAAELIKKVYQSHAIALLLIITILEEKSVRKHPKK